MPGRWLRDTRTTHRGTAKLTLTQPPSISARDSSFRGHLDRVCLAICPAVWGRGRGGVHTHLRCSVCVRCTWRCACVLQAVSGWQLCCRGNGQGCVTIRGSRGTGHRADISVTEGRLIFLPTSQRRGGAEITDTELSQLTHMV